MAYDPTAAAAQATYDAMKGLEPWQHDTALRCVRARLLADQNIAEAKASGGKIEPKFWLYADEDTGGMGYDSPGEPLPRRTGEPMKGTQMPTDHDDTCDRLVSLQKTRRFCITSQSRCDRSTEAYIASFLGYSNDDSMEARKARFKLAADVRKSIEKGTATPKGATNLDLQALAPLVSNSAKARQSWDALRTGIETEMRARAVTLPAYSFVKGVKGFGDLGFGVIIGETGNLSNYATVSRVWKRLGLAVFNGAAQKRTKDAEQAAIQGYNPKRRAEVWAICSDSMFRHQWRGKKEDASGVVLSEAHAIGPYGEVYGIRKLATLGRVGLDGKDWSDKRRDSDARRIMTKSLLKDLWVRWNVEVGTLPAVEEELALAA